MNMASTVLRIMYIMLNNAFFGALALKPPFDALASGLPPLCEAPSAQLAILASAPVISTELREITIVRALTGNA